MTSLPIAAREMRVLASNARFYWARATVAGFAVLSCLQWFNFNSAGFAGPSVGQTGLEMLSRIGLVLALSAVAVTADSIAHERREGTLALLFLSTMKSRDVVFGKMAVMGWVAFYALLGFAPVLMLTLLAGGVTGAEVARTVLVLLNILFVSLAAGLVEVLPVVLVYVLPVLFFGVAFRAWLVVVPLLFVVKNLFFLWWAWARLRREFRARDQSPLAGLLPEVLTSGGGSWRVMRDA